MREKLILFLKQFPSLHRFVQNFYWKFLELKVRILGTRVEERKWASRDINNIKKRIQSSLNHPHRQLLIEKINTFSPISSILEIGCGYGANLYLLAKQFPKTKLVGIDINPLFIQEGNKLLIKDEILNVKLICGKIDELRQFRNKSFDIVFTDALLMYIGPDKIKKIISEVFRIARRALILVEWHCENWNKDPYGLGIYYFDHWIRNYTDLLKQFISKDKVRLTKIPKELWLNKNWQKFGYLIEVTL